MVKDGLLNSNVRAGHDVENLIANWEWRISPLIRKRNWNQLATVLSAAVTNEKKVPLSPLGKNLFESVEGSSDILNDGKISRAEAKVIAKMIKFGLKYYGKPVFDYFAVEEERYEDVDFWRNLIKVGRETGPDSANKRIEALKELETKPVGGEIQPNRTHLQWAQNLFQSLYPTDIVSTDKRTSNITFSSEKSTTNSGEPYYVRKNRVVDGVPVRELIAKESNSLDLLETAHLPAFLGARAQRGKWNIEGWDSVEDFIIHLAENSTDESDIEEILYSHITFANYKARIISAAPSIDAYQKSALMYPIIEAEKAKKCTNAIHLQGPLALKEWMIRARKFASEYEHRHGVKISFYNADATTYDRTLRKEHAQWLYDSVERKLPRYSDKKMCKMMFISNMVREVLFVEEPTSREHIREKLKSLRVRSTLRSGEVDTNYFGSSVIFLAIHAARREVNPEWSRIIDESMKENLGLVQTDGDDNITVYIGSDAASVKTDLENTVSVLEKKYGLILQDPTNKGELGLFYTQFRLTKDSRFITPLSRMRLYWKESSKTALPAYTYVVTLLQNLEFRKDCKGAAEFVKTFILPYDATRLGTVNMETGKPITYNVFRRFLREEAKKFEKETTAEMLYSGNPYDDHILNKDGEIAEDWLLDQWTFWRKMIS